MGLSPLFISTGPTSLVRTLYGHARYLCFMLGVNSLTGDRFCPGKVTSETLTVNE